MKNMSKIGKMKLTSITTQTPNCKMTSLHNDFSHSVLSRNNIGEDSEMGRKASLVLKMDRPGDMELFLESLVGLFGQLRSSQSSSNISVINNNVTQNIQNQIKNNIAIFNQRYHDSNITAILNQLNGENSYSNPAALESVHQQLAETLKKNFNLDSVVDKRPAKVGSLLVRETLKSLVKTVVISRPKVLLAENHSDISYKIITEAGKMLTFVTKKAENTTTITAENHNAKPVNHYYKPAINRNEYFYNTKILNKYSAAISAGNVFQNPLNFNSNSNVFSAAVMTNVENNVANDIDSSKIQNSLISKTADFATNITEANSMNVAENRYLMDDFTENNELTYISNAENVNIENSKINQGNQSNVYRSQENKNTINVYNNTVNGSSSNPNGDNVTTFTANKTQNGNIENKVENNITSNVSPNITENITERATGHILEDATEGISERISEYIAEHATKKIINDISNNTTNNLYSDTLDIVNKYNNNEVKNELKVDIAMSKVDINDFSELGVGPRNAETYAAKDIAGIKEKIVAQKNNYIEGDFAIEASESNVDKVADNTLVHREDLKQDSNEGHQNTYETVNYSNANSKKIDYNSQPVTNNANNVNYNSTNGVTVTNLGQSVGNYVSMSNEYNEDAKLDVYNLPGSGGVMKNSAAKREDASSNDEVLFQIGAILGSSNVELHKSNNNSININNNVISSTEVPIGIPNGQSVNSKEVMNYSNNTFVENISADKTTNYNGIVDTYAKVSVVNNDSEQNSLDILYSFDEIGLPVVQEQIIDSHREQRFDIDYASIFSYYYPNVMFDYEGAEYNEQKTVNFSIFNSAKWDKFEDSVYQTGDFVKINILNNDFSHRQYPGIINLAKTQTLDMSMNKYTLLDKSIVSASIGILSRIYSIYRKKDKKNSAEFNRFYSLPRGIGIDLDGEPNRMYLNTLSAAGVGTNFEQENFDLHTSLNESFTFLQHLASVVDENFDMSENNIFNENTKASIHLFLSSLIKNDSNYTSEIQRHSGVYQLNNDTKVNGVYNESHFANTKASEEDNMINHHMNYDDIVPDNYEKNGFLAMLNAVNSTDGLNKYTSDAARIMLPKASENILQSLAQPHNSTTQNVILDNVLINIAKLIEDKSRKISGTKSKAANSEKSSYKHYISQAISENSKFDYLVSSINYQEEQNHILSIELKNRLRNKIVDMEHSTYNNYVGRDFVAKEDMIELSAGVNSYSSMVDVHGGVKKSFFVNAFRGNNVFMKWLVNNVSELTAEEILELNDSGFDFSSVINIHKNLIANQNATSIKSGNISSTENYFDVSREIGNSSKSVESMTFSNANIALSEDVGSRKLIGEDEKLNATTVNNKYFDSDNGMFINTFTPSDIEGIGNTDFGQRVFVNNIYHIMNKNNIDLRRFSAMLSNDKQPLRIINLQNNFVREKYGLHFDDIITVENINNIFGNDEFFNTKSSVLTGNSLSSLSQDFGNYLMKKYDGSSFFNLGSSFTTGGNAFDFSSDINEYLQYVSLNIYKDIDGDNQAYDSNVLNDDSVRVAIEDMHKYTNEIYPLLRSILEDEVQLLVRELKHSTLKNMPASSVDDIYNFEKFKGGNTFDFGIPEAASIENISHDLHVTQPKSTSYNRSYMYDNINSFDDVVDKYFSNYGSNIQQVNVGLVSNTSDNFNGNNSIIKVPTNKNVNYQIDFLQWIDSVTNLNEPMYDISPLDYIYPVLALPKSFDFGKVIYTNRLNYFQGNNYSNTTGFSESEIHQQANFNEVNLYYNKFVEAADIVSELFLENQFATDNSVGNFETNNIYLVYDGTVWRYVNSETLNLLNNNHMLEQVFNKDVAQMFRSNVVGGSVLNARNSFYGLALKSADVYNIFSTDEQNFMSDDINYEQYLLYNYYNDSGSFDSQGSLHKIYDNSKHFNEEMSGIINLQKQILTYNQALLAGSTKGNSWGNIFAYVTSSQINNPSFNENFATRYSLEERLVTPASFINLLAAGDVRMLQGNSYKTLLNSDISQVALSNSFEILRKNTSVFTERLGANHSYNLTEKNIIMNDDNVFNFATFLRNLSQFYDVMGVNIPNKKISNTSLFDSNLQHNPTFSSLHNIQNVDRSSKNQYLAVANAGMQAFRSDEKYNLYGENLVNLIYSYYGNDGQSDNSQAISSYYNVYIQPDILDVAQPEVHGNQQVASRNHVDGLTKSFANLGKLTGFEPFVSNEKSWIYGYNEVNNFDFSDAEIVDIQNYYDEFIFNRPQVYDDASVYNYTEKAFKKQMFQSFETINSKRISRLNVEVLPRILQNVMSKSIIINEDFLHNFHEDTLLTHKFASQILESVQGEILQVDTKKIQVETDFRTQKIVENVANVFEETLEVVEKNNKTQVENFTSEIGEKLIIKHSETLKENVKDQLDAEMSIYMPDVKGDILVNLQKEEKEISKISQTLEREMEIAIEKMVKVKVAEKMAEFEAQNKKNEAKKSSNKNDAYELLNPDVKNDAVAKTVVKNIDVDAIYDKVYARIERALINEKRRIGQ